MSVPSVALPPISSLIREVEVQEKFSQLPLYTHDQERSYNPHYSFPVAPVLIPSLSHANLSHTAQQQQHALKPQHLTFEKPVYTSDKNELLSRSASYASQLSSTFSFNSPLPYTVPNSGLTTPSPDHTKYSTSTNKSSVSMPAHSTLNIAKLSNQQKSPIPATTATISSTPAALFDTKPLVQEQQKPEPQLKDTKSQRKYKCKTCEKYFTTSGHLARHSRIHTGERKHLCPFPECNARFARHDNCMQHYRTHMNPKARKRRASKA